MAQSKGKFDMIKIKESMIWSKLTSNKKRSIVTGIVLVIVLVVSLVLAFAIPKKSPEKEGKFEPRVSVLRPFSGKNLIL